MPRMPVLAVFRKNMDFEVFMKKRGKSVEIFGRKLFYAEDQISETVFS